MDNFNFDKGERQMTVYKDGILVAVGVVTPMGSWDVRWVTGGNILSEEVVRMYDHEVSTRILAHFGIKINQQDPQ